MKIEHFYETIPGYFTFEDFYRWAAEQVVRQSYNARCVEVGVFSGRSAAFLGVELANACANVNAEGQTNGSAVLDLVDGSFAGLGAEGIRRQLAPIESVIDQIHVGASWEIAALYPNASLDFVYLDAGHDYADLRKDIDAWRPKLVTGGILAGHDYTVQYPGVIQAVNETFDQFTIWRGSKFENGLYYPTWCVEI